MAPRVLRITPEQSPSLAVVREPRGLRAVPRTSSARQATKHDSTIAHPSCQARRMSPLLDRMLRIWHNERVDEQILVVDADPRLVDQVRRRLTAEGYIIAVAYDGETGLTWVRHDPPNLLILEANLPGLDGLEVCRRLRAEGHTVPILILTARDAIADRVAGLDAGADDYLIKPFVADELSARVRALLRRYQRSFESQTLRLADLVMNIATREVRRGSRLVDLTAREFDILELFMRNPHQVLTRDIIYDRVWGYDFQGESNIIEAYIFFLRSKLEADHEPRLLHTVRGVGYALRED